MFSYDLSVSIAFSNSRERMKKSTFDTCISVASADCDDERSTSATQSKPATTLLSTTGARSLAAMDR